RGAGLVELYAVYGLVLDLDALHVLSADVQDAVYIRFEESCGIIMRDCLHLSFVEKEGGLDQRLAVTGGAGVYDLNSLRKLAVDILVRGDRSAQRISDIVVVEVVEECTVLSNKCDFCRGRARIDAEACLPAVGSQILYRHQVLC